MKESSNELLQDYLNGSPNAFNPIDDARFARYAIACAEEGKYIDIDIMSMHVDEDRLGVLESAFEWIRVAVDCLKEDGRI